jgi:uncharacterized membrane protein HdeD (DUF308 family)
VSRTGIVLTAIGGLLAILSVNSSGLLAKLLGAILVIVGVVLIVRKRRGLPR